MNAVEIEEAVSKLVEAPFDAAEFPYAFLEAFGNKSATLQRLRSVGKSSTNKTDVDGDGVHAVLQRNNIHMATLNISTPLAPEERRGEGPPIESSPLAPEERRGEGPGERGNSDAVSDLLRKLVERSSTAKHKVKFALATDGKTVHAECLNSAEPPLVCEFEALADHFGYFLERSASKDSGTRALAAKPHQFREMNSAQLHSISSASN